MQRIFNRDGFNWWIGVVEDRQDPEQIGRCRVRIFGYHTDAKELLPTEDLPWCVPIQPITSAATSGLGSSPLGPVEGTWVIGFFLDGEDMQQPAMFGTISTKAAGKTFSETPVREPLTNPVDEDLKDNDNKPVIDNNGNKVKKGVPKIDKFKRGQTSEKNYTLGAISQRNESQGRIDIINPYKGEAAYDYGGASYGKSQLASFLPPVMPNGVKRHGDGTKNSPVLSFIRFSRFKKDFDGLLPATDAFDNKWKEIAKKYPKEFEEDQTNYILKSYYGVTIAKLQRLGLDLTKYGPGVQELVYTTSVALGPNYTACFVEPLRGKSNLTGKDIINLVTDWKKQRVPKLYSKCSVKIQQAMLVRLDRERVELLALEKE